MEVNCQCRFSKSTTENTEMSDLKIAFIAAFFFSSEQAALITPKETMTHVQHLQPGGGECR